MSSRYNIWFNLQCARARVQEITDDMPLKHVIIRCMALVEAANNYQDAEPGMSHRYEPRTTDDAYNMILHHD